MPETNIIPIRALSDNEALAWIVAQRQLETTGTALARDWDWTRSKVRRRLANWSAAGLITVEPGRHGRKVITPAADFAATLAVAAAHPAPTAHQAASVQPAVAAFQTTAASVPETPSAALAALPVPGTTDPMVAGRATGFVDLLVYAVAIGLASTAAYFSVRGMVVLFPAAPIAIVGMALAMEAAKLVTVAFLARQWQRIARISRAVLVVLVAGLAAINAVGVYSQLVAAHLGDRISATSSLDAAASALASRIEVQTATVADLDRRVAQIDAAIGEMIKRGRTSGALDAIGSQRKVRDALVAQRRIEADTLAGLKSQANAVTVKSRQVEVENAPIMYVAQLMGGTTEQTIRLLILLMVLTCDPLAIALTAAAAANRKKFA